MSLEGAEETFGSANRSAWIVPFVRSFGHDERQDDADQSPEGREDDQHDFELLHRSKTTTAVQTKGARRSSIYTDENT